MRQDLSADVAAEVANARPIPRPEPAAASGPARPPIRFTKFCPLPCVKKLDGRIFMRAAMQAMTLGDVDREYNSPRFMLNFSGDLEEIYRMETMAEQTPAIVATWLIGSLLFSMFIISDYFLSNEFFIYFLIGRFGILLPCCLTTIYFVSRKGRYYDILICVGPVMYSATLYGLLLVGHGDYRSYYMSGGILIFIYGCVVTRPRLRYSVVTALLHGLCYQVTLQLTDIVGDGGKIINTLFCFSGCLVTVMTAYVLEQISRRAFLLGLRARLLNRELEAMAMTDPLTGLGNRRALDDATRRFWTRSADGLHLASLILIDVDRFKTFNDTYGHSAGDLCLTTIGRCIAARMRDTHDLAVRFGGEEIIVFLPDTDFTTARQIAESLRLAIMAAAIPHPAIAEGSVVTASLGVATTPTSACTAAELVISADTALYAAKHAGRNRVWPPLAATPGEDASERLPGDARASAGTVGLALPRGAPQCRTGGPQDDHSLAPISALNRAARRSMV